MTFKATRLGLAALCLLPAACGNRPAAEIARADAAGAATVAPALATGRVENDPDDPAIWVHPERPEESLIVGTDKEAAPKGGLYVFNLGGKVVQTIRPLDRPNNVDIRQGIPVASGGTIDIAVVTERYRHRLRIYRIDPVTRRLSEAGPPGGVAVFEGEAGEQGEPMGIALYSRSADGAFFAIVGRKTGPATGYLWQYRLEFSSPTSLKFSKVREFGAYSGKKEIEAIAVDDELGFVYYADETTGVRKYHADPGHPDASRELATLATSGFRGDHEGIAIYRDRDGSGYLILTDQIPGNSDYHVFTRQGPPDAPHRHDPVGVFRGGADSTDGIEVTSRALGPAFPRGLFVAMNSGPKNFLVYRWTDVAAVLGMK